MIPKKTKIIEILVYTGCPEKSIDSFLLRFAKDIRTSSTFAISNIDVGAI